MTEALSFALMIFSFLVTGCLLASCIGLLMSFFRPLGPSGTRAIRFFGLLFLVSLVLEAFLGFPFLW
jgi:hypothetical protein